MKRQADEVGRRLESEPRDHTIVAALHHHVQRRMRVVDGRIDRDIER